MDPDPAPDPPTFFIDFKMQKKNFFHIFSYNFSTDTLYHRERILETSTLSCNEEEEDITKPPKR
jgi:hypothetical protein